MMMLRIKWKVLLGIIFFLSLGVTIVILMVSLTDNNDPSNWSPWFAFYKSKECILTHNTYNTCLIVGSRPMLFPEKNRNFTQNMYSVITDLDLHLETSFRESSTSGWQKKLIKSDNWICQFTKDSQVVNMSIYLPQRGDTFACWPQIPLKTGETIIQEKL